MNLEITSLYAVPLAILMFVLWMNVTKTRAKMAVSIGNNGDVGLHEKIRRHGNFIEWVPMVLLMMLIAEMRSANGMALHVAGVLLVLSRVAHPFGLRHDNPNHALRIIGNTGSLLALFVATGANVWTHFN